METHSVIIKMIPVLLLLTVTSCISSVVPAPSPAPASRKKYTDLILTSCSNSYVVYPKVCNTMLNPFRKSVKNNFFRLVRVALNVAYSCAKKVTKSINNSTVMAMHNLHPDCQETLSDARSSMYDSVVQMKNMTGSPDEVRFKLSNVQTWCSAVLTDVDTCTDGDSPSYADSGSYYDAGKQQPQQLSPLACGGSNVDGAYNITSVTSNALALVNMFADQVRAY